MIELGDNPQGTTDLNKFMCGMEGLRGKLVAIHKSKRKAIIISCNDSVGAFTEEEKKRLQEDKGLSDDYLKMLLDSTDLIVEWGKLYLVSEGEQEKYPVAIKQVKEIPKDHEWDVVFEEFEQEINDD